MAIGRDTERAKKTLYVTGFSPKLTNKLMLEELFTQGAPVKEVTMFDTHAYILFHHEESVAYCLALFNEIELHGHKLRLNPKYKSKGTFCYMKYLAEVREKLMSVYMKMTPPALPARKSPKKLAKKEIKRPKQKKKKLQKQRQKSKNKTRSK